ncbi:hypothetical protein Dsin_021701 [Dipteronia sinensis]|uniref:Uncharacterized protein n=1 Tax=Dipteronia sinensis TaxID=43782 RepID=A0AAE0A1G7_9ROSI|nr:hypothetical protein Dsin_021701 [Dipteronia sinensis]
MKSSELKVFEFSCFLKEGFVAGLFWNIMTTDSEEETSSEFEETSSESQKTEQAAVERVKKPGKKPGKKRLKQAMERAMERAIERKMEPMMLRVMERKMEPMMERVMERVMEPQMKQVTKRVVREMKSLIGTSGTPGAPADRNINPRPSLDHQITRSEERNRLRFVNKFRETIFTKDKITDESGRFVGIQLINTANVVVKESIGVEILVLEGDLGFEAHEDWTEQQFNAKIVRQRDGKGPLVKGKLNIRLTDGVGTIEGLIFNYISRWINGRKFRLGARVLQSSIGSGQVRIMEAIMNKKNHLPSLDDEVWRLKKITRGGKFHTRLIDKKVLTVRDFKKNKNQNPNALKQILKDCSDMDWKVMLEHADSIVDDDNSYSACQEAEAYNTTTTTGPPLHQGSLGMQNYSNRASSSQPPAMSAPHSQFNPQMNFNNYNHQPYNMQSNDLPTFPPSNTPEPPQPPAMSTPHSQFNPQMNFSNDNRQPYNMQSINLPPFPSSNTHEPPQPPAMSTPHSQFNPQMNFSHDNQQPYNMQSNDLPPFPPSNTPEPLTRYSPDQELLRSIRYKKK